MSAIPTYGEISQPASAAAEALAAGTLSVRLPDGLVSAPGLAFTTGPTSGLFHAGTTAGDNETIKFAITGVTRLSLSKTGVVVDGASGLGAKLTVVETATTSPRGILSVQYSTGTDGARVGFAKARGTEASPTTVVSGDTIGRMMFRAHDGTNFLEMASLEAGVTGTVATGRVPTYVAISVATNAAPSVLTEMLRITAAGLGIGTDAPAALFHAKNTSASANPALRIDGETGNTISMNVWGSSTGLAGLSGNAGFGTSKAMYLYTDGGVGSGGTDGIFFLTGGYQANTQTRMVITGTGNIVIGATAAGSTASKVLALTNGATAPTASADLVHLYGADHGGTAGSAALALYQEVATVTAGDNTADRYVPVTVNGVALWLFAKSTLPA